MKALLLLLTLATSAAQGGPCGGPGWPEQALARSLAPAMGLPAPPHPQDTPPTAETIALGAKLFFDRRLSVNGSMSCAMCHVPEQAFTNTELLTAVGVEGRSVKRSAPTLLNVGQLAPLMWDGREPMLETQWITPLVARNEMANPSAGQVIARIASLPDYDAPFAAAFGAGPSLDRVGQALGAYQRTLVAAGSPFDQWRAGDADALTAQARRGFALFTGTAGCASCHLVGANTASFTDGLFHDNGFGFRRERERQAPPATTRVQVAPGIVHVVPMDLVRSVGLEREPDLGRYEATLDPADRWRFRTAPLRNIALTAPYMHDGALPDLRAVIDYYDAGGAPHPEQDPRIRPLGLGEADKDALEAFLRGLTSPELPCLVAEARAARPGNY